MYSSKSVTQNTTHSESLAEGAAQLPKQWEADTTLSRLAQEGPDMVQLLMGPKKGKNIPLLHI